MPGDKGEEPTTLYLVVYGNYYPLEVDSIWSTKEAAYERADKLGGMWGVAEMVLDLASDDEEVSDV